MDVYGERKGSELLGVGRTAFLRICAGARVMAGTLALVREKMAQDAQAETPELAQDGTGTEGE